MPFDAKRLVILDQIDSTNNYAMEMVQLGELAHGDAVFALDQTAGKGRMGRTWRSERGANLILTLVVQMQWLPVVDQFRLSAAVSLGCRDFFQENIKENLKIKWPNDIYINDSKAGGILIENVIKGNLWQWAVIGIGLNLNQVHFESMDPPATSLKAHTGKDHDVLEAAHALHRGILKRIEGVASGGFPQMLEEYNHHLYGRGKKVRLRKENVTFETTILGVSPAGELVARDVLERRFLTNEVSWKAL